MWKKQKIHMDLLQMLRDRVRLKYQDQNLKKKPEPKTKKKPAPAKKNEATKRPTKKK